MPPPPDFYLRLFIGASNGEYIEFELAADGELRYTNRSKYRGEESIRKRLFVSPTVLEEITRIVHASQVMQLDDRQWPPPDRDGRQELEVRASVAGAGEAAARAEGNDGGDGDSAPAPPAAAATNPSHVSLATTKLTSTVQISRCEDAAALRSFYFLCQDLKTMLLALVQAHFQVQPI